MLAVYVPAVSATAASVYWTSVRHFCAAAQRVLTTFHAGAESYQDVRIYAVCCVCHGSTWRHYEEYARVCISARLDGQDTDGEANYTQMSSSF